jgi:hypothetical protein
MKTTNWLSPLWGLSLVALSCSNPAWSADSEFDLSASFEGRYFLDDPLQSEQDDSGVNFSLAIAPEYYLEWERGGEEQSFTFEGFVRIDQHDDRRTHGDIREAYWHSVGESIEIRAGIRRVFWGVTESAHLVDIINQTDGVENLDGEDKLGQPMLNIAWVTDFGTVDFFFLPYFRERTFPGPEGRLRPFLNVETDDTVYEDDAEERHNDFAVRWANSLGGWDIGLSFFKGTAREPRLLFAIDDIQINGDPPPNCVLSTVPLLGPLLNGLVPVLAPNCEDFVTIQAINPHLVPAYDQIEQSGLELQYLTGGWFLKLEAIHYSSRVQSFTAVATGFEYTWGAPFQTAIDISLIGEYLYDDRGALDPNSAQGQAIRKFIAGEDFTAEEASGLQNLEPQSYSPFQDDVFIGSRLALNDVQSTELLAGVILDRESDAWLGTIEASRRLGENWKASIELRTFQDIEVTDPLYSVSEDSHVQLELTRYF